MQNRTIAEKLEQELTSVSTDRTEHMPLREERDPFTFLKTAAVNIREAHKDLKYIGCYHACNNGDMGIMYRAVRQDTRLEYAGILHGAESFLWIQALIALAGNDHVLVRNMLPRDTGYCDRLHTIHKMISRLLTALYYKDDVLGRKALETSETFLGQKHPKIWLLIAEYLCALWRKETDRLSSLLTAVCAAERKSDLLLNQCTDGIDPAPEKTVSFLVHGLFVLAQHCLSPEEFQQLPLPEDRAFLKGYEEYRRTADGSNETERSNAHFIHFTGDAAWLNEVVDILPETVLKQEPDGDVFIDHEDHYEKLFTHLLRSPAFQRMYQDRDVCWAAKWDTFNHFLEQYRPGDERRLFYGRGLLYYALANPDLDARYRISHFLLDNGAGVQPVEREYDGPFHYLLRQKYHDIPRTKMLCEELLRHGADPNQAGARNLLPIECMIQMQYSETELTPLYELWLSIPDLELNLRTFGGRRPIDLARECGRKILAERLETMMCTDEKAPYTLLVEKVDSYDWSKGGSFPGKVLKNDLCDLALALKIFYLLDGYSFLSGTLHNDSSGNTSSKISGNKATGKQTAFIEKLYTDILKGRYNKGSGTFKNPLTKVQKYKLRKLDIPDIFLEDIS